MFQRSRELALEAQQKRREQARDAALQDKAQLGAVTRQAAGSEIDVGILHAFLEGASWADAFDSYFIGFCPEFAGFVVGQEYTLQQTDIHINFVKTAERLLDKQLGAMSIAPDQFLQQCLADIKTAPPGSAAARAAQAVMERLEECADFERFGTMMRRRYERIQAAGGSVEDDDDLPSQPEPQTETHAELSSEEAELMREQEHIRAARERRKRAREEAVARAAAAAEEIDVFDAQPEPEPEPEPEQEPQPPEKPTSTTGALDSWEDGSDFAPPPKWEVGTVHRGVVSFWENMPGVGGYGMILKMGKPEIVSGTHCDTCRTCASLRTEPPLAQITAEAHSAERIIAVPVPLCPNALAPGSWCWRSMCITRASLWTLGGGG